MSYRDGMHPAAVGIVVVLVLLLLAMALVVSKAVGRQKRGRRTAEERGWQRHPDGTDVVAGWDGWPFLAELDGYRDRARGTDIMTGHHNGARFLSLRYSQHESGRGSSRSDIERYNMVALATEHSYPHLSVIQGRHKVREAGPRPGPEGFGVGDRAFDKGWQILGDADFGRAVLTPEVREAMEEVGHAWVFQPGWVVRVTPWTFWSGEDTMLEELEKLAAPLRAVPSEVWARHGGPPDFLGSFGQGSP